MSGTTPLTTADRTPYWDRLTWDYYLRDETGHCFRLRPPHRYFFGRTGQVHIAIDDELVSRRHGMLQWDQGRQWTLADLGSRNGTWHNDRRIDTPVTLQDRDLIRIGRQPFRFLILPHGTPPAAERPAETRAPTTVAMQVRDSTPLCGRTGPAGIVPILDFLISTQRTGHLAVEADGQVWLDHGRPVHACFQGHDGMAALVGMALLPAGTVFRFADAACRPDLESLQGDGHALMQVLSRRMREGLGAEELIHARRAQHRLLDRLPDIPGYDLAVHYEAHDGIGGDFYDAGAMSDGDLLTVVGDVSGHGLQAALIVPVLLKTLRLLRSGSSGIIDLVARLNDEVIDDLPSGVFATLSMAALHPASGRLQMVLAGHHQAWIAGPAGVRSLGRHGMALGMASSDVLMRLLSIHEDRLVPGEILLQCTDGLLEAGAGDGHHFGDHELETCLASMPRHAQDAIDHLAQAVRNWSGTRPGDDITILALARR